VLLDEPTLGLDVNAQVGGVRDYNQRYGAQPINKSLHGGYYCPLPAGAGDPPGQLIYNGARS